MGLLKSLVDIASTPVRCLGELGKDLSSLGDERKDGDDGILAIGTMGLSSVAKGVFKSLKKAGDDLDK
jgi:hypothetical protein